MQSRSPADELSEIRAELVRLQAREASLCAAFLRDPVHGAVGRFSRVEIVHERIVELDLALVPDDLRAHFIRERVEQKVQSQPLPTRQRCRPGWPMQRDTALH